MSILFWRPTFSGRAVLSGQAASLKPTCAFRSHGALLAAGLTIAASFGAACPLPAAAQQPPQVLVERTSDAPYEPVAQALWQLTGQDGDAAGQASLRAFYEARGFQPAWSGSPAAERAAAEARQVLRQADAEGLQPLHYSLPREPHGDSPTARAQADLQMTATVLRYARDVHVGRLQPQQVYDPVLLPVRTFDAAAGLTQALAEEGVGLWLQGLPPVSADYAALRAGLARYRALEAAGGWPEVPPVTGNRVEEAETTTLRALQERLAVEDPTIRPGDPLLTPALLTLAVQRFQESHGLKPDGRPGPDTLRELNKPVGQRIGQILANMERWRWLPPDLGPTAIVVDLVGNRLKLLRGGEMVLTSKVIVGARRHPTPILYADVTSVTANPPWDVPYSIASGEILPKLKRNPNYLAENNMVLRNGPAGDPHGQSIDWQSMGGSFPYRIRQLAGPQTALGRVKLEMPNRYAIFLHDTPARSLFDRFDRFLSHGCVRVEEIQALASNLLSGGESSQDARLQAALAGGQTKGLPLSQPVPAYLLYWTAVAAADGSLTFRPDVYGYDQRLITALERLDQPAA